MNLAGIRWAFALFLATATACGGANKPAVESADAQDDDEDDGPTDNVRGLAFEDEDEDDAGDGMMIESQKGHLDVQDIQDGIAQHTAALSDCYRSHHKRARYVDGKVELKYVVDPSGAVKQVQVLKSDLGAWAVERCLLDVSRAMTFVEPRGRGDADFTVPLDFSSESRVRWLTEEEAESQVASLRDQLAECEGEASAVDVTLYVGRRGVVKSAGFAATEEPFADEWADCAEELIKQWQLVDPRGRIAKLSFRYQQ